MFKNVKRISLNKINNNTINMFETKIKSVKSRNTHALFIDINSICSMSDSLTISNLISNFKKEKNIPVYTFAEDSVLGPSLLILLSGDKVFADEYTIFGLYDFSIAKYNFYKLKKNNNLDVKFITSGKNKIRLNPFEEFKNNDEEWLINILKKNKQIFYEYVKQLRVNKIIIDKFMNSEDIFMGHHAKVIGLIDDFKSIDDILFENFKNLKVKNVKSKISLNDLFKIDSGPFNIFNDFSIQNIELEITQGFIENILRNNIV